jgi:hypothetical protein
LRRENPAHLGLRVRQAGRIRRIAALSGKVALLRQTQYLSHAESGAAFRLKSVDLHMSGRLKLIAMDGEDLAVISAHCQDAVLKVGDLDYLPRERRFIIAMNRFAWETVGEGGKAFERRKAVLHFERVGKVRVQGIDRRRKDMVLSLLSVTFKPGEAPAGLIELAFAGGATLHLEVECIEARLSDLEAAWSTSSLPRHDG